MSDNKNCNCNSRSHPAPISNECNCMDTLSKYRAIALIGKSTKEEAEKGIVLRKDIQLNEKGTDRIPAVNPDPKARQPRPIPMGVSGGSIKDIFPAYCCSGTLGCLLDRFISGNRIYYILSNAHVFAGDRILGANGVTSQLGDAIRQPGAIDVGCQNISTDTVATLSSFVTIKTYNPNNLPASANLVDVAVAQVNPSLVSIDGYILNIGQVQSTIVNPTVGLSVKKNGRTTSLTTGTITAVDVDVLVSYADECGASTGFTAYFQQQIMIQGNGGTDFALGGDSGSLIVTDTPSINPPAPVGLLFAGGGGFVYANRMFNVLDAYRFIGFRVVGSDNASPTSSILATDEDSGIKDSGIKDSGIKDKQPPFWVDYLRAVRARNDAREALFRLPFVIGSGIIADPKNPNKARIQIYLSQNPAGTQYPPGLNNIPVDLIVTGPVVAFKRLT